MRSRKTLGEFIIENQQAKAFSTGEFSQLIHAIRLAAKIVNHEVNKAGLVDLIGGVDQKNSSGEQQQKLDVTEKYSGISMESFLWSLEE